MTIEQRLHAYRLLTDEGEEELIPEVKPNPASHYRMIPLGQGEAEQLEYLGQGLCRLGATTTGMLCLRLAASFWESGSI